MQFSSVNSTEEGKVVSNKLSEEEKATLEVIFLKMAISFILSCRYFFLLIAVRIDCFFCRLLKALKFWAE